MSNEIALMSLEDNKPDRVNLKQVTKRVVVVKKKDNQFDLALLILKKSQEKKEKSRFGIVTKLPLPSIREIDGIRCNAQIMVSIQHHCQSKIEISLRMEAVSICGRFDNPHVYFHEAFYVDYKVQAIEELLVTLFPLIKDLKYNPMMCKFMPKDDFEMNQLIDERLKDCQVVMHTEACAVCFEPTRAKTECNHTLCVPCADKIQSLAEEDWDEDTGCGVPCCPLCREEGHFHITFSKI